MDFRQLVADITAGVAKTDELGDAAVQAQQDITKTQQLQVGLDDLIINQTKQKLGTEVSSQFYEVVKDANKNSIEASNRLNALLAEKATDSGSSDFSKGFYRGVTGTDYVSKLDKDIQTQQSIVATSQDTIARAKQLYTDTVTQAALEVKNSEAFLIAQNEITKLQTKGQGAFDVAKVELSAVNSMVDGRARLINIESTALQRALLNEQRAEQARLRREKTVLDGVHHVEKTIGAYSMVTSSLGAFGEGLQPDLIPLQGNYASLSQAGSDVIGAINSDDPAKFQEAYAKYSQLKAGNQKALSEFNVKLVNAQMDKAKADVAFQSDLINKYNSVATAFGMDAVGSWNEFTHLEKLNKKRHDKILGLAAGLAIPGTTALDLVARGDITDTIAEIDSLATDFGLTPGQVAQFIGEEGYNFYRTTQQANSWVDQNLGNIIAQQSTVSGQKAKKEQLVNTLFSTEMANALNPSTTKSPYAEYTTFTAEDFKQFKNVPQAQTLAALIETKGKGQLTDVVLREYIESAALTKENRALGIFPMAKTTADATAELEVLAGMLMTVWDAKVPKELVGLDRPRVSVMPARAGSQLPKTYDLTIPSDLIRYAKDSSSAWTAGIHAGIFKGVTENITGNDNKNVKPVPFGNNQPQE